MLSSRNHLSLKKPKYLLCYLYSLMMIILSASPSTSCCSAESISVSDAPKKTIRILSLDGAGVDAVSQAFFLERIEKETGKSIPEIFHMVGSVSLSSFLSLALTTPANEVAGWKPKINSSNFVIIGKFNSHKIYRTSLPTVEHISESICDLESYAKILSKLFGRAKISDSIIDTVVITQSLDNNRPKVFKSWENDEDFLCSEVALASAATPRRDASYSITTTSDSKIRNGYLNLADAKKIIKNPTVYLLNEARKRYPNCNYEIVSVGSVVNATEDLSWQAIGDQATMAHHYLSTLSLPFYTRWTAITHNPYSREDNGAINNLNYRQIAVRRMLEEERRADFQALINRLKQPRDLIVASCKF